MKNWKVVRKDLTDLLPASYNPRKITEKAFQGLGGSIDRFGLLIPLVWNERTGNIVGGHQRYRCLVEQGETEADVMVVDIDEKEEVALNITLNNKAVRGDFTDDVRTALAQTEARIGSAFNDIGLSDLVSMLGSKSSVPKSNKTSDDFPKNDDDGGSGDNPQGDDKDLELDEPDAVIVCPDCGSKWKMKNNEVIHNAVAE